jgi:hypothetical protein
MQTNWLDPLLSDDNIDYSRNGAHGNKVFLVLHDFGTYRIKYFEGVGTGVQPSKDTLTEVDFIKLVGEGLTSDKMFLTQYKKDLVIEFEGIQDVKIVLSKFNLEDLDNLTKDTQGALNLSNVLFDGENYFQDSFDVINADSNPAYVFRPNAVTFLNYLDNNTSGYDNSNDIINGQEGNDTLLGLSGDDLLRGGNGDDILTGGDGKDQFWLASNSLPEGVDTITDFQLGVDSLGIAGIAEATKFEDLSIIQNGNDTNITVGDVNLAVLTGIQASSLDSSSFVFI